MSVPLGLRNQFRYFRSALPARFFHNGQGTPQGPTQKRGRPTIYHQFIHSDESSSPQIPTFPVENQSKRLTQVHVSKAAAFIFGAKSESFPILRCL